MLACVIINQLCWCQFNCTLSPLAPKKLDLYVHQDGQGYQNDSESDS